MTPEEFDVSVQRTGADPKVAQRRLFADNGQLVHLLQSAMGIGKEAGELLDALYKKIYYGKDLDVVNVKEELGDLCWYMSQMIFDLDSTWEEIWQMNSEKLRTRYPEKFTEEKALNRDLENERKVLEG